jgi:Flp pilus assembly protein protease CpaA
MKDKLNLKFLLVSILLMSLFSTIFLQMNDVNLEQMMEKENFAQSYVHDKSNLPDVQIVKEVFKSIFNIVKF